MTVAGVLGDFDVASLLQVLVARKASGRLRVAASGEEAGLYLVSGSLVTVTSARLALRLGRVLRQRGLLNDRQLAEALEIQATPGETRPLGEIIVAKGWVTPAQIAACVQEQAVAVLTRLLIAEEGSFAWEPGVRPPALGPGLDARKALLEALRRAEVLRRLRAILPPPHAPLVVASWVDPHLSPANEAERRVLAALRAGAASWGELIDLLPLDETGLLRAVAALRERGLVITSAEALGIANRQPGTGPVAEADLARLLTDSNEQQESNALSSKY